MTDPASQQSPDDPGEELPFISHLIELRERLLRIVFAVIAVFLVLAPFANRLFTLVAGPLSRNLPPNGSLIAIEVASPFFTPFKLAMVAAVFIAMPYILYQLWAFVAPGLYKHEKRRILPLLISSTVLFYLGATFAYFVVFPIVFGYMTKTAPAGVEVMTDITRYLDFVLTLFLAFGAAFEVPIATVLLVWSGVLSPETLRQKRSYVVVACFVIGAVLTPPDVISQTLLAVPMWMLFETGLFMSRYFVQPDADAVDTRDKPMTDAEMDRELDRIDRE